MHFQYFNDIVSELYVTSPKHHITKIHSIFQFPRDSLLFLLTSLSTHPVLLLFMNAKKDIFFLCIQTALSPACGVMEEAFCFTCQI